MDRVAGNIEGAGADAAAGAGGGAERAVVLIDEGGAALHVPEVIAGSMAQARGDARQPADLRLDGATVGAELGGEGVVGATADVGPGAAALDAEDKVVVELLVAADLAPGEAAIDVQFVGLAGRSKQLYRTDVGELLTAPTPAAMDTCVARAVSGVAADIVRPIAPPIVPAAVVTWTAAT